MGYSAADEAFTHQLPRLFNELHDPDPTWSDRCFFFAGSPDGKVLVASGYGNNPNTTSGLGYAKVTLADGRHWDLMAGRPVTGAERADLSAGPNDSGIRWELYSEPSAPMWELLPIKFHGRDGKLLADLYHMKEPGHWTGLSRSTVSASRSTIFVADGIGPSDSGSPTGSTSGCGSMPALRTDPSRRGYSNHQTEQ